MLQLVLLSSSTGSAPPCWAWPDGLTAVSKTCVVSGTLPEASIGTEATPRPFSAKTSTIERSTQVRSAMVVVAETAVRRVAILTPKLGSTLLDFKQFN